MFVDLVGIEPAWDLEKATGDLDYATALVRAVDARQGGITFLFDTGANAHVTNSKKVFIKGTERACNVLVYGISESDDDRMPMRATVCGDIVYNLSSNKSVVLRDVLFVESAVLGEPGDADPETVLVSGSKFVSKCGVGLMFPASGDGRVEFVAKNGSYMGHFVSKVDGLFVDKVVIRSVNAILGSSSSSSVRSSSSSSSGDSIHIKQENEKKKEDEREREKLEVKKNKEKRIEKEARKVEKKTRKEEKKVSQEVEEEKVEKEVEKKIRKVEKKVSKEVEEKKVEKEVSKKEGEEVEKEVSQEGGKGGYQVPLKGGAKAKEISRLLHRRLHFGKTRLTIKHLEKAYGVKISFDECCDACLWAKARLKPAPTCSHRKATKVGERLHYDVFTSPVRSDTQLKYLLVVIDEYSGYIWAYGMRKKSETRILVQMLIKQIERKYVTDVLFVSALRSDNAGENVSGKMLEWTVNKGIITETTVPNTPHQNGRAERAGGVVWEGGAALRFGGNLPDSEWLRCCLAFIHHRNRLPSHSGTHGTDATPYEVYNRIKCSALDLVGQFRRIGCLCHVALPPVTKKMKKKNEKESYRAVLLGYADKIHRKAFIVRDLSTGEVKTATFQQITCFESELVYEKSCDYDAWLRKNKHPEKKLLETVLDLETETGPLPESESVSECESDDDRMSELVDSSESESEYEYESESESEVESELEPDVDLVSLVLGGGLAPASPLPQTRSVTVRTPQQGNLPAVHTHSIGKSDTTMPAVVMPHLESGSQGKNSPPSSPLPYSPSEEEDKEEERWVVNEISSYRRVGKKRGGMEYKAVWDTGEETWEPARSFRDLDPNSASTHLHVFQEFKEKIRKGEVEEFKEENNDIEEVVDAEIAAAIEQRSRVLKMIVKAGVEVPETRKEAQSGRYWKEFSEAEGVELGCFDDLDVWELVPKPKGVNVVGTRWVYDVKIDKLGNIVRYKARLVAQGFSQKEGIDFNETFAPTMHLKTARVLLALAARNNLEVRQYDVSTAFLHASLTEEVYVKQPPGHVVVGKEDWVLKLNKAMYGLKNAPRAYSDHFMGVLTGLGFKQSASDDCLWMLQQGTYYTYYLFHVDDILCVSNSTGLRKTCFKALEERFGGKIRDEGPVSKFLGLVVDRLEDGSYTLSQRHYIEKMAEQFNITGESRGTDTPGEYSRKLTKDMLSKTPEGKVEAAKLPFQQIVGCLIYVVKTRPDVAFAISDVARFMSNWGVEHFKAALRILRYLYTTREKKILLSSAKEKPFIVTAYCDANYGDDRETEGLDEKWKSQGGYITYIADSPVSWRSRRHKSRALSSMEAEYMEASEAAKEVLFLRVLLKELNFDMKEPSIMYEDNKACISFSKNNTCHDRTKHIDIRAFHLRSLVKEGLISVVHIDTKNQLADMMTKHQLKCTFIAHRDRIFSSTPHTHTHTTTMHKTRKGFCGCLSCFVGGVVPCAVGVVPCAVKCVQSV